MRPLLVAQRRLVVPAGSKEAVAIMNLAPDAYIAQVSSTDAADTGQALIEVYVLP